MLKKLVPFLAVLMAIGFTVPQAQAGLVSTAEVHQGVVPMLQAMPEKRSWLEQQLIEGGVEKPLAVERVAALTDAQINEVYQKIDEQPAGGNTLLTILFVVLILEVAGVTDLIPFIRPVNQ